MSNMWKCRDCGGPCKAALICQSCERADEAKLRPTDVPQTVIAKLAAELGVEPHRALDLVMHLYAETRRA
jgi:hypothetical protein